MLSSIASFPLRIFKWTFGASIGEQNLPLQTMPLWDIAYFRGGVFLRNKTLWENI